MTFCLDYRTTQYEVLVPKAVVFAAAPERLNIFTVIIPAVVDAWAPAIAAAAEDVASDTNTRSPETTPVAAHDAKAEDVADTVPPVRSHVPFIILVMTDPVDPC